MYFNNIELPPNANYSLGRVGTQVSVCHALFVLISW